MDSLFLMQRYWGSDEESEHEITNISSNFHVHGKSKFSNKKIKSDELAVGRDDDDDDTPKLSNKKQRLDLSVEEIGIARSSEDSGESDIQTVNDQNSSLQGVKTKDTVQPKNSDFSSEEHGVVNDTNSSFSLRKKLKNANNAPELKTPEKQKAENCEEEISYLDHNVSAAENGIDSPKSKKSKISSTFKIDVSNIQQAVVKKQKKKEKKIDKSSKETEAHAVGITDSHAEIENKNFCTIGRVWEKKNEIMNHALPSWLSNPTYISVNLQEKEIPISDLNYLDSNTKDNLKNSGINYLFPVQCAVIPWLMQSKEKSILIRPSDICVSAPTGSGKTLAFVIPIVQSLRDRVVCAIRALVVLPVSELAIQVYNVFKTFTKGTDLKVALLTGRKSFVAEQNALVKMNRHSVYSLVDIVVTTPGRINDHIYKTRGFCLKRLRYLVIDEADRMMEEIQQGWLKQVEDAVFHLDCAFPKCVCSSYKRTFYEPTCAYNFGFVSVPLQKLLYSATLTHDPEQLHTLSLYKPKLFTASAAYSKEENVNSSIIIPNELTILQVVCEAGVKPMVIFHLIKQHNFKKVLCFAETVERAHRLHLVLEEMGWLRVREISSSNRTVQRKIVLEHFTSGKVEVLVCSDLVARGIDIEDIDCVISYDIPKNVKIYTHRIGRTARAGKTGMAITLLSEGEIPRFKKILKPVGIEISETLYLKSEDLEPFVKSYQTALSIADGKLKKERQKVFGGLGKSSKIKGKQK